MWDIKKVVNRSPRTAWGCNDDGREQSMTGLGGYLLDEPCNLRVGMVFVRRSSHMTSFLFIVRSSEAQRVFNFYLIVHDGLEEECGVLGPIEGHSVSVSLLKISMTCH